MKLALGLVIAGVLVTLLGFAILIGSLDGAISMETGFAGFPMIILGPLTIVGGLMVHAFRRPTAQELASQKARDYRTWQFRPVGLVIFLTALGGFVALGLWIERYVPGFTKRSRPGGSSPAGFLFGLVIVSLLSFRRIRNTIFYTKQPRSASTSGSRDGPEIQEPPPGPGTAESAGRRQQNAPPLKSQDVSSLDPSQTHIR
jgi:hypothetical protein